MRNFVNGVLIDSNQMGRVSDLFTHLCESFVWIVFFGILYK